MQLPDFDPYIHWLVLRMLADLIMTSESMSPLLLRSSRLTFSFFFLLPQLLSLLLSFSSFSQDFL